MEKQNVAREILGGVGRMIASSKGRYNHNNPRNLTVFNGNICLSSGKIWHGDLDITEDEAKLAELSQKLGETLYILYESDARFENEEKPKLEKAVAKFENGKIDLGERAENFIREDGKLLEKRLEQEKYEPTPEPEWEEDSDKYTESDFFVLGSWPWKEIEAKVEGCNVWELTSDEKKQENPLSVFFMWASKEVKKHLKEKEQAQLYVRSCDNKRITEIVKKFMINRMELEEDSYDFQKEINWLPMSLPMDFYGSQKGPKWTQDNIVYFKKVTND